MSRRTFLWCLLLSVLTACTLEAEEKDPSGKLGFFFGGLYAYQTVLGDFTGDLYLFGAGQACVVPEVGDGWGWGGLLGSREHFFPGLEIGLEISYTRSAPVGTWGGASQFESRLEIWGFDIRMYPIRLSLFEPFVLLGGCGSTITVFDGATDGSIIGDAIFNGWGWDLGGGASLLIGKHLSLVAQAVYHWTRYNTVEMIDEIALTISDGLEGRGFGFSALLLITL